MAASLFVSVQEGIAVRVCRDLVHLRTQKPVQFVDLLGEWQSVFLVELDGPRSRTLSIQVLGVRARDGGPRP